ncbi:fimbrial protein [Paraburkholderia sp.]|uniref:fimbrial protein n=1 Tax=Paraburkholderia sp. TaxID=1926495 RepID=UPI0025EBC526|nr:fimbrial protein [Paraburkholderia sp.]
MKTGSKTLRARHAACVATLALLAMMLVPGSVLAASTSKGCYKIQQETGDKNAAWYTQPGSIAKSWYGAADKAGKGAYAMTVQLTNFSNNGDLIGSRTAPLDDMGADGVRGYTGEQILFRCSPDSEGTMYEFFSTNGDNSEFGGTDVSDTSGIPGTYKYPEKGIVSRVTNVDTGQVVTRHWKARLMTGLDRDEQNWFLVKVKNFSRYRVDLYQCTNCGSKMDHRIEPIAYVAFRGGKSGNIPSKDLKIGDDHNGNVSGWHHHWPGAIHPKHDLIVRTGKLTCAVRNTTPIVRFPPMSVEQLERGEKATMPITIDIQCENGFGKLSSGLKENQTAIGFLAREENAAYARPLGLVTGGSAVTDLLSDGYGTKNVAKGVSVTLSRPSNNGAIVLLTNRYVTLGGYGDGWYPVLLDTTQTGSDSTWDYYTRTVNATFEAFNPKREKVTPGKYNATAEVVIAIQ